MILTSGQKTTMPASENTVKVTIAVDETGTFTTTMDEIINTYTVYHDKPKTLKIFNNEIITNTGKYDLTLTFSNT